MSPGHQSCIGNVSKRLKNNRMGEERKHGSNFLERNAALQPLVLACFLFMFTCVKVMTLSGLRS